MSDFDLANYLTNKMKKEKSTKTIQKHPKLNEKSNKV